MDPLEIVVNGRGLSAPERSSVRFSFELLRAKYSETGGVPVFWGKITGTQRDYLICQIQTPDNFGVVATLFSTDGGVSWTDLPPVPPDRIKHVDALGDAGLYTGDPDYEYRVTEKIIAPILAVETEAEVAEDLDDDAQEPSEPPSRDEDVDEEDEFADRGAVQADDMPQHPEKPRVRPPPAYRIVPILERERLAVFLEDCSAACRLAPKGAALRTAEDPAEYRRNELFSGLAAAEASDLSSWFFLRLCEQPRGALLPAARGWRHGHGLDAVALGPDATLWAVTETPDVTVVSSLMHTGAAAWLEHGGPGWGCVYFGDGRVEYDCGFAF
eukprot:TRINITY_DN11318_c0_g1_i2.p1 TRINITY_DN11318_c0_g1~~TRINITY_DN11318_c0_g1_i2.p1  ORF type:complete len:328 (+),score=46.26 TRINITY_DN11318_c0_g1_i2:149-1132(+)